MKGTKILYWATTIFLFLFQGVMPALTSQTELAKTGVTHLGYPLYFLNMLTVFNIVGALALIIPAVKRPYKDWAYAGFGILFISATVSHSVVDGFGPEAIMALVCFGILALSYTSYAKLSSKK